MQVQAREFTVFARLTRPDLGLAATTWRSVAITIVVGLFSYVPLVATGNFHVLSYGLLNVGLFGVFWVLFCTFIIQRHARVVSGLSVAAAADEQDAFEKLYEKHVRYLNSPKLFIYSLLSWALVYSYILADYFEVFSEIRGPSLFVEGNRSWPYLTSIGILLLPAILLVVGGARFLRSSVKFAQGVSKLRFRRSLPALKYWLGEADREVFVTSLLFASGLIVVHFGLNLPTSSVLYLFVLLGVSLVSLYGYLISAVSFRQTLSRNAEARLHEAVAASAETEQELALNNMRFSGAGRLVTGSIVAISPIFTFIFGERIKEWVGVAIQGVVG